MYELGNVIPRIIWPMARAPNTGVPILFSKIDLKDGYWRMLVDEEEAWNFAYVLPKEDPNDPNEETLLVIPDALQMGWSESPPFFCVATETAQTLLNNIGKSATSTRKINHAIHTGHSNKLNTQKKTFT